MNDVQRSQKAKDLVAQIEGEVDPDCEDRNSAVKMRLALGWIREEEEVVESRYEREHKW